MHVRGHTPGAGCSTADACLPARAGIGFKPVHFTDLMSDAHPPAFIEVHAENYMGAGGPPHARLSRLRQDYALSIHGVGLSIGGTRIDPDHLARIRGLCDRYAPDSFSEHLAWSSHDGAFLNDLLPLPYTPATLDRVVAHVDQVQTALRRPILLENPATYVVFADSEIPETEFLAAIAERTGCGLLLDVNNVYVNAVNHGYDARDFLARMPTARIASYHVAGHYDEAPDLKVDTHGAPVKDDVWSLLAEAYRLHGVRPTLLERDFNLPPLPVLQEEVERIRRLQREAADAATAGTARA